MSRLPDVAVAVTTIGRPAVAQLLASLAASRTLPVSVAVAHQGEGPLPAPTEGWPFPLVVVRSGGGASRGRNEAVAALGGAGDVLAFPNDDSVYEPHLVEALRECFAGEGAPDAVAVRLEEHAGPRFVLPPPGTPLTKRTVWRAIEPTTFVRRPVFEAHGGFDEALGTGAGTDWGSGEGTDLLLRIMAAGGTVVSRSDLAVLGFGERRTLDDAAFVRKHRSYARGTGYLYRAHDYPARDRIRTLAGTVLTATRQDERLTLSLRLALARLLGRTEGLTGRSLARGRGFGRPLGPDARVLRERHGE